MRFRLYRCAPGLALMLFFIGLVFPACSSTPETKPLVTAPAASLQEAVKLIENKEFDEARQILNEIKNIDTTRTFAPLAQLKLAESYQIDGDDEIAVSEYRKFLEQYPDSQYASYAQFQIASIYFSEIKGPERGAGAARLALREYQKLKDSYPRNPYREVVEIHMQKAADTIAESEFLTGMFYYKKDSYQAALGRFLGILTAYPAFKDTDKTFYYISLSYKKAGDQEKAFSYLGELSRRFPDSPYVIRLTEDLAEE